MNQAMIEHAIEACITYAADAERPFQQVTDVLVAMRRSPDWSEAELLEVQSRVLMQLIKQAWTRHEGTR
jgi:hypothetical protein